MSNDEWLIDTYEKIVTQSGAGGITVKDARDRVAQAYEVAIRSGELKQPEIDLYAEGLVCFDQAVRPRRKARTMSLHNDMQRIVEALSDETILGLDDPILHIAYPLGTRDGRDKILALWTSKDWSNAAITRYRNAAEVTASAQIFDEDRKAS